MAAEAIIEAKQPEAVDQTVSEPAVPEAVTSAATDAPKSMLDAINQSLAPETAPAEPKPAEDPAIKPKDEAKPNAEVSAEPEKKPAADEALKMPSGLTPDAQQRFRHLTGLVKEKDRLVADHAEQIKQRDTIIESFRSTMRENGVTAQDFDEMVGFARALKSGQFDQARQWLESKLKLVALAQGRPATSIDALADFPDLAQEVAAHQIPEARALEIARGRLAEQARAHTTRQAQQATQQRTQIQSAINAGVAEVEAFSKKMAETDLDWPIKEKALAERMEWLAQNVPPHQWRSHIEQFYSMLQVAPVAKPATVAEVRPLRSSSGAGGVKPSPTSTREAIDQALGFA